MGPKVEIPLGEVSQPVFSQSSMSVEEKRIWGQFFILNLPSFLGETGEDVFMLMDFCKDRIQI